MPPANIKQDVFLSLFFNATSKSKISLDYLFHKFYAGFKPDIMLREGKEILPFLEVLSVQTARQRIRPEYFSQTIKSSLALDEVEDIWLCIEKNDDWSKFEEKINNIRHYRNALHMD